MCQLRIEGWNSMDLCPRFMSKVLKCSNNNLIFSGTYLVRVRAQVMTREGSPGGGWVPLANGGFSNVSIRKRLRLPSSTKSPISGSSDNSAASKPKHDYFIYAKRVSDSSVSMSPNLNHIYWTYTFLPPHISLACPKLESLK